MAFQPGYKAYFNLASIAAAATDFSKWADNISAPQTTQMLDVSVFGTVAKSMLPGLSDGDTITLSGPYDVALHTAITALKAGQSAGSAASVFFYGPGGSVASQARISGTAYVASYAPSNGVGGRAEWAVSLQVTGAVTNGTF
jgi:hypothetical protein